MKPERLTLKDFRGFTEVDLAFDQPLNIFAGLNHAGKSSLRQAIELSMTTRSDGTDHKGTGAMDKIRIGGHKAIIDLVLSAQKGGNVLVKTTYGPNKTPRAQIVQGESEGVGQGFMRWLEKNNERLSCVLDPAYFINLKPEEQKAVLGELVAPTSYELDEADRTLAEKHLGAFMWAGNPIGVIDKVYDAAYNARKDAKATLAGIRVLSVPPKPAEATETIQKKVMDLRTKASKESAKVAGGGSAATGRLAAEIDALGAERMKAFSLKDELRKQQDQVKDEQLSEKQRSELKSVIAGRAVLEKLESEMETASNEGEAQRAAVAIYQELRLEPFCPTCTQSITDTFIDGKIAEHERLTEEATSRYECLQQQIDDLGDIEGAVTTLEADDAKVQSLLDLKRQLVAVDERITKLSQDLDAKKASLTDAKAKESAPADTSVLDKINVELSEWEAKLGPALNYDAQVKAAEDALGRQKTQQAFVNDLETLCKRFGKDGIKAGLIAEHIEQFTKTVNEVLQVWGYRAELCIEPYDFRVDGGKGLLPLKELSGSEQLMFGVALQCAISIHGKIRFVIVDRADTFVASERARLYGCLDTLLKSGCLERAFIMVSSDVAPAKKRDGVAYYQVADGTVTRL